MANPITGYEIGAKLVKALGLEGKRVSKVDLHFECDQLVTVTVERAMFDEEAMEVVKLLDEYCLVKKQECEPCPPAHR